MTQKTLHPRDTRFQQIGRDFHFLKSWTCSDTRDKSQTQFPESCEVKQCNLEFDECIGLYEKIKMNLLGLGSFRHGPRKPAWMTEQKSMGPALARNNAYTTVPPTRFFDQLPFLPNFTHSGWRTLLNIAHTRSLWKNSTVYWKSMYTFIILHYDFSTKY